MDPQSAIERGISRLDGPEHVARLLDLPTTDVLGYLASAASVPPASWLELARHVGARGDDALSSALRTIGKDLLLGSLADIAPGECMSHNDYLQATSARVSGLLRGERFAAMHFKDGRAEQFVVPHPLRDQITHCHRVFHLLQQEPADGLAHYYEL